MLKRYGLPLLALLVVCSFTLQAADSAKKAADEKKNAAEARVDKTVARPACEQQRFHFTMEAMGLFRTAGAKSAGLAYDDMGTVALTDDVQVMDTKDLQSGSELALSPKLTFSYDFTENQALEASYFGFGMMDWESNSTVRSTIASLYAPFEGLDENFTWNFWQADRVTAKYRSELNHNAELSYRRTLVPSSSCNLLAGSGVLGGVRYMNIEEEFAMNGAYADANPAPAIPLDTYRIRTSNDLIGAQLGGVLALNPHSKIRIELTGKVGLMANMIDKVDAFAGGGWTGARPAVPMSWKNSTDSTEFAFLGDLSARISGKVHENIWLTASYNAMFVENIALAPEQFDGSAARTHSDKIELGDAIYHGFTAGLTIRW